MIRALDATAVAHQVTAFEVNENNGARSTWVRPTTVISSPTVRCPSMANHAARPQTIATKVPQIVPLAARYLPNAVLLRCAPVSASRLDAR